jgi:hypothetical protein
MLEAALRTVAIRVDQQLSTTSFIDPSEICVLEFKGEFRRFGICSVSATIGTDRSNFKFCGESGIIGLAEKRPSAMINEALAKLDPRHSRLHQEAPIRWRLREPRFVAGRRRRRTLRFRTSS